MNRIMCNALSITLLAGSAWLAPDADAAMRSGMQCPIGPRGSALWARSVQHGYSRAARHHRLQEWRKRRQEFLQRWRTQRRWLGPRHLALRPEPPTAKPSGPPARVGESPSLQDLPDFESPRIPQGLDFQPPELEPSPFPERFPAPPTSPDYPAFARFAPPTGYLYGYPLLQAHPLVPRPTTAPPYRASPMESVRPAQADNEVRSQGYGEAQSDVGTPGLEGEDGNR